MSPHLCSGRLKPAVAHVEVAVGTTLLLPRDLSRDYSTEASMAYAKSSAAKVDSDCRCWCVLVATGRPVQKDDLI